MSPLENKVNVAGHREPVKMWSEDHAAQWLVYAFILQHWACVSNGFDQASSGIEFALYHASD